MTPIKILIAEDHALLADGLQLLLGTQPDMLCLGVVRDGAQALAQTLASAPDVLLLDLGLPRLDGLGVMEVLQREQRPTRVLVVTARLDEASIRSALALGAAGYLPKDEDSDELLLAIRRVAQGRRYTSEAIAQLFTMDMQAAPPARLTASESAVLQLVGAGLTSKEIGQRLGTSEATARKHRENIRRKLGMRNSAEMAAYATRLQSIGDA